MKKTILDLTNEQAREYFLQASNYCNIDLPKYFDFQPMLDKVEACVKEQKLFNLHDKENKPGDFDGVNYKFFANKDGNFAWRPFQIINPVIYVCLVNRITENNNWEEIKSRFSEFRKNNDIQCYSIPLVCDEGDLHKNIASNILNWWQEIEQQSIELALKFNCVLSTDITDCYGAIYTHTIGWALHEKNVARDHRNIKPPTIIGCIIDDLIQSMSYRQTNGIPQGSVLMDFIAEMVLGYVDLKLSEKIKEKLPDVKYRILRYRDDYRIFAKTQEDAVKITKLLSEQLTDLNLKLNTQKTFVSDNIIGSVIKPDKLYWNESKQEERSLQKHLLLIYSLSEKYPNSGSLSTALSDFLDRIYPLLVLKDDSSLVLVSILVDIAYNNPRTYAIVIVCIGKILSIEMDHEKVSAIYKCIEEKFKEKPNVGYWDIWFQRLSIKKQREFGLESSESLCKIAAGDESTSLWNMEWLKKNFQEEISKVSIFSDKKYNEMSDCPQKNEAKIFGY